MNSNFYFVKEKDTELFRILLSIESRVKIDPYGIGNDLRQVLEILCAKKIKQYNLHQKLLDDCRKFHKRNNAVPSLSDQFNYLSNSYWIRNAVPSCQSARPLPSFRISDTYLDSSNGSISRFENAENLSQNTLNKYIQKYTKVDSFLRQIGNDYSHSQNPYLNRVFKRTYENLLDALRYLHKYIWLYYGGNHNNIPKFQEDFMPILNYHIEEAKIPEDIARGLCQKEFSALRYEEYREAPVGSSIIRQYSRIDENSVFLRRAPDVFLAADNCGSLLKQVSILSEGGKIERPFYIIAYDFRTHAQKINNTFLGSLSIKERVELCLSYALVMKAFHQNPTPIYHRVFNSGCAYYADERSSGRGISTAIIKFEFAKIADQQFNTVVGRDPSRALQVAKHELRYLAPEWNSIESLNSLDWAKVDIYSLGIFFSDILTINIEKLNKTTISSIPQQFLPLIQSMTSSKDSRPSIDKVCEKLKGLLKNELSQ